MKKIAFGAIFLALCAAALQAAGPPAPLAAQDADDTQDVLYVGQPHPVLIRLHVRMDGLSIFERWEKAMTRFFQHLDRNGSGSLDRIEAERMPSVQMMFQFIQGNPLIPFNARARRPMVPFAELDRDRDGKVTLEEFKNYYARNGAGPVQIQAAFAVYNPGTQDSLSDALFNLLDTNRDGKLSRAELENAEKVLMKLDTDDNELISQQEVGLATPPGDRQLLELQLALARSGRLQQAQSNLMLISRDDGRRASGKLQIARDVLARYDRNKDGKLSREEIGFPRALFDRLDRNGDGMLDVLELVRWTRDNPSGEFTIRLRDTRPAVTRGAVVQQPIDRRDDMGVSLDGVRINVVPQPSAISAGRDRYLLNLFDQADAQKKGFVSLKQVEGQQFIYLRGLFTLADRNSDGRLTKAELEDYLDVVNALRATQISLSLVSAGRGLFQVLDANGDGQLSIREMRNAWKRLAAYDTDGDGCISRSEFPFQFNLNVGAGMAAARFAPPVALVRSAARSGVRAPARGPVWFRKMDRNGDGDVSLSEWLGTREQFDEIDTDRDGLISLAEAEAYDRLKRSK
jgi:Ca2+-binding EF-hand superfamily protein